MIAPYLMLAGAAIVILAFIGPRIGLGKNEQSVFYIWLGLTRSNLAEGGAALLVAGAGTAIFAAIKRLGVFFVNLGLTLVAIVIRSLRVGKLRALAIDFCIMSLATAVVFIGLNLLCAWILARFPQLLDTEAARITREFNVRFTSRQSDQAMKWLQISDPDELQAFFVENSAHSLTGGNVYEDFTMFKVTPWRGKFFNFTDAGYREVVDQGPWPPSPDFFNIFFFGGSTTMGIGPDWTAIPSYLQAHLVGHSIRGKPVKVYNFGRGSYFSTPERILFEQLLLGGYVPDMVVFLDGLNDFFFLDGRPAGWSFFEQAYNAATRASVQPPSAPLPLLQRILAHAESLPMAKVAQIVHERLYAEPTPDLPVYKPETVSRDKLENVISRYLRNKHMIEAISRASAIIPVFIWQPVPGYRYDLTYDISLNPLYGLGGHERSSQGYPLAAERRATGAFGDDFLWLADIQENRKEPLYMDAVHYTAQFSSDIAQSIAEFLIADKTVSEPSEASAPLPSARDSRAHLP